VRIENKITKTKKTQNEPDKFFCGTHHTHNDMMPPF
jgi:hypothetical protein